MSGGGCSSFELEAARVLIESGAVLRGEFKLASGGTSDVYIDARRLLGMPRVFKEVAWLMHEVHLSRLSADAIIGVATGGIPWATVLGYISGKPVGYVRPRGKEHGLGRVVEGAAPPGRVVVVDDVATTGGSIAAAVSTLRSEGFTVDSAIVIVDREEGASARLKGLGVTLRPLTRMSCLRIASP